MLTESQTQAKIRDLAKIGEAYLLNNPGERNKLMLHRSRRGALPSATGAFGAAVSHIKGDLHVADKVTAEEIAAANKESDAISQSAAAHTKLEQALHADAFFVYLAIGDENRARGHAERLIETSDGIDQGLDESLYAAIGYLGRLSYGI